jgi:ABC-type sugar transport system substrate-binding protein
MKTNVSMDRRTLLKTAAAASAATAAGALDLKAPSVMTARAEEAIKLGVLLPKSGPYTVQGENGSQRRAGRRRRFQRARTRPADPDRMARRA